MHRLNFTTKVLGETAAGNLRARKVTQTIRSQNSEVVREFLTGELKIGDQVEVALDNEVIGLAYPAYIDRISGDRIDIEDAKRGGFERTEELVNALQRGGFRFQPLRKYLFYRVLFTWLGET